MTAPSKHVEAAAPVGEPTAAAPARRRRPQYRNDPYSTTGRAELATGRRRPSQGSESSASTEMPPTDPSTPESLSTPSDATPPVLTPAIDRLACQFPAAPVPAPPAKAPAGVVRISPLSSGPHTPTQLRPGPFPGAAPATGEAEPLFDIINLAETLRRHREELRQVRAARRASAVLPGAAGAMSDLELSVMSASDDVASVATTSTDRLVELCIGQVPHFLDGATVGAFLCAVAPLASVKRCVVADGTGGRMGLCFVLLKDNGAAQTLMAALHQRVWFSSDRETAHVARNAAAEAALRELHQHRAEKRDRAPQRRGDGLPLRAMTVEWSRSHRNDHVRTVLAVPHGPSAPAPSYTRQF